MELPTVASIAVAAPLDKLLSYRISGELRGVLQVGHRVRVPLGRRTAIGFVFDLAVADTQGLKTVTELLDGQPLFSPDLATFYERAARYYAYPIGEAVRTALPAGLSTSSQPVILHDRRYRPTALDGEPGGCRQQELLAFIRAHGEADLTLLRRTFPAPHAPLGRLVGQGYLEVTEIERPRDPLAAEAVPPHRSVTFNPDQAQAFATISEALTRRSFAPILLHGVTGSGKTEVYLRAIAEVVADRRQALLLVPEIGLTPQLVARVRSWFQDQSLRLAVFHSGLSDGERFDAWRRTAGGEIDVVIGVRSAVFAPLARLGLIIVDEEHDASYKQGEGFRYHARDLALMRGQMGGATVILGSATPALTTFQRARDGQLIYLQLPARVAGRPLPEVTLLNLAEFTERTPLSAPLQNALAETLAAGDQALLLLNRRGYAPFLLCHDCGASCRCPNCEITLTYSRVERTVRCHYCDFRQRPPDTCPRCGGQQLLPEGLGTERLEEALCAAFPQARIARMDRDTTSRKGAHGRLVNGMHAGAFDILIGTQMIAKGHDFGAVTLVGVIDADAALNLPDFRSAERVFSLLSQVAGRAGRGERPGRVLIQTYAPDHYTLEFVSRHDYHGFAAVELAQRRDLGYPPFGYLVNLVLSGTDADQVQTTAAALAGQLTKGNDSIDVLGPAPCLLRKLRGRSRVQILLKGDGRPALRHLLTSALEGFRLAAGVTLMVDIDPLDMM